MNKTRKYLPIGALGVSLLLHLGFFLGVSGVIIIQAVTPKIVPMGESSSAGGELPPPPELPDHEALELADDPLSAEPSAPVVEQITGPSPMLAPTLSMTPVLGLVPGRAPRGESSSAAGDPQPARTGGIARAGNPFGERKYMAGTLVGRMYDFKKTADGQPTKIAAASRDEFDRAVVNFVKRWDIASLAKYYQADRLLGTPHLFIPMMSAGAAPHAFGVAGKIAPSRWLILYQGRITPPRAMQLRFVGVGDDFLVVRIDGKVVLDAGLSPVLGGQRARRELPDAKPYADRNPAAQLYAGDWLRGGRTRWVC
ncbi:MAG: hypothetical protein LBD30_07300 [Verrucomicrobiales bacterium]|jgi:hypothetical protein|nr:hypothetical protein [Verrucomicrobiales bacterium]